jgi:general stress protein CsbA
MKGDLKKNPAPKVNYYYAKEGKKYLSVWWIVGIGIVSLLLIFLIYAAAALHP